MCLVPEGGGRNSGPWCLHCIWTVACATWLLLIRTAANAKSAGYSRSPPSFICRVVHLLRCGNGILWKENICTHRLKSTLFPQTLRLLITSPKFQLKNSLKRSESAPVTCIKINYTDGLVCLCRSQRHHYERQFHQWKTPCSTLKMTKQFFWRMWLTI